MVELEKTESGKTKDERVIVIHAILKGEYAELFLKLQDLVADRSTLLGVSSRPTKVSVLRFLLKDYFRLTHTLTKILDTLKTKHPDVYGDIIKTLEQSK